MPKSGRGRFPLKGCVQWYVGYWRDRAQGRREDTHRTRKSAAEALLLETKVRQQAGRLVDRAEVLQLWTGAVGRLSKAFETLPNNLAREFNWSPDVVRSLRASLDDFRRAFVRDTSEFVDVVDDDDRSSQASG